MSEAAETDEHGQKSLKINLPSEESLTQFAEALAKMPLTGDAAQISYELGLLSPQYQRLAAVPPANADTRALFLAGLATGSVKGLAPPDSMTSG